MTSRPAGAVYLLRCTDQTRKPRRSSPVRQPESSNAVVGIRHIRRTAAAWIAGTVSSALVSRRRRNYCFDIKVIVTMPPIDPASAVRSEALAMLRALIGALSSSARAVEQITGITNAQLFLLQQLAAQGPCSLGELAALAHTQPSTVSLVIGRLQRAGFVTRVRSADDRRRAVIALTADGRRLVRRAPTAPTARLLVGMRALDGRDAKHLALGMRPLLAALGASHAAPPMLFETSTSSAARRRAKPTDSL